VELQKIEHQLIYVYLEPDEHSHVGILQVQTVVEEDLLELSTSSDAQTVELPYHLSSMAGSNLSQWGDESQEPVLVHSVFWEWLELSQSNLLYLCPCCCNQWKTQKF
jgi:hypothetical protein